MNILNYQIDNKEDKESAVNLLTSNGFSKVGHIKKDCVGFCIVMTITKKQFFEISEFRHPSINLTSNLSKVVDFFNCT